MFDYLKLELKNSIFSKYFLIAYLITFILLLYSFFEFITLGWGGNIADFRSFSEHYDFIDLFIISRSENRASYLGVIAPLLASLIYSDSYLSDKTTNYINFIYMRISKRNYLLVKLLVNFISSGFCILISSLSMLLFLALLYGVKLNPENALNLSGAFSNIYFVGNKYLYVFIIIIISCVFYTIFSSLSLAISSFIKNKYIAFFTPFFYYIISGSIFVMLGFHKLNATTLFMPNNNLNIYEFIFYQLFLLIIGIILFIYGVLNSYEKNN